MINSRIIIWAEEVVGMGHRRCPYRFWCLDLRESDHLVDPGGDGRIILRWISKK